MTKVPEPLVPPPPVIAPRFLKPKEFAALTGVNLETVYRCLMRGEIKSTRLGVRWLIPVSEIERLLAAAEGGVA